ncbi:MAG: hypothetical protein JSS14_03430 [Proteobacteria bacterium]|nr:hypothetical protein [Pseudomonadota bacterium]
MSVAEKTPFVRVYGGGNLPFKVDLEGLHPAADAARAVVETVTSTGHYVPKESIYGLKETAEAVLHQLGTSETPPDTRQAAQEDNQTMAADLTREEMNASIKASQGEMRAEWAEFRAEMADFRSEMKTGLADLRAEMHKGFADNIKWTVTAIVAVGVAMIAVANFFKPAPVPAAPLQAPVTINMPAQAVQPAPTPPKTN